MKKTDELAFMMAEGGFVIQAHPYREAHYIDHIRLFPRSVHGVEVINSYQAWEANEMAAIYAKQYGLLVTAGSDNHYGSRVFERLREKGFRLEIAGVYSDTPVNSVDDYVAGIKSGELKVFSIQEHEL